MQINIAIPTTQAQHSPCGCEEAFHPPSSPLVVGRGVVALPGRPLPSLPLAHGPTSLLSPQLQKSLENRETKCGQKLAQNCHCKLPSQMHDVQNMETEIIKYRGTWSTKAPLGAALRGCPLLAQSGTASGTCRSWSGNGTGTGNCGGESVWAREISGVRVGFAPDFIGDAVAAFVALLPVPRVTGELAPRLLLV